MKIRILSPCYANKKVRQVGDIVEVSTTDGNYLRGIKRGEKVEKATEQPAPSVPTSPPAEKSVAVETGFVGSKEMKPSKEDK